MPRCRITWSWGSWRRPFYRVSGATKSNQNNFLLKGRPTTSSKDVWWRIWCAQHLLVHILCPNVCALSWKVRTKVAACNIWRIQRGTVMFFTWPISQFYSSPHPSETSWASSYTLELLPLLQPWGPKHFTMGFSPNFQAANRPRFCRSHFQGWVWKLQL